ncbi:MAG: glycerate kinase type-2 family protein [Nitrospiraceae bacterium]
MIQIGLSQPQPRALASRLCQAALIAADPALAIREHVTRRGAVLKVGLRKYDLRRYRRIVVVGAGKASARMGQALEPLLRDRLDSGLVVVKYGHRAETKRIQIIEAGHPVPDEAGVRAGAKMLALVNQLTRTDLLFVLLSGGASSLLPAPVAGLSLAHKQQITQLLLRSGAAIQEINAVRKHVSAIKGGQLAAATSAQVVSLIVSDVIGDDLASIGSGPTAPDPTTYADARTVLRRYRIWNKIPAPVRNHLASGQRGKIGETPKRDSPIFRRVHNHLIGNNRAAVAAVSEAARRMGLNPLVLTSTLTGEAREMAKAFGAMAREIASTAKPVRRPCCIIAGGELTVTVRGSGLGGRAQEFALAAAIEIGGLSKVWIAAFGTDGTDGPTDAAGAVVDGETVARARKLGLDLHRALDQNDAYHVFRKLRNHIITGPTGTNVNDLYFLLAL